MPELPEVETIVRSLRPRLIGRRVSSVWGSGLPLRLARPVDMRALGATARGARIDALERSGKYMILHLAGRGIVVVHLGMSGRLRLQPAAAPRARHTHVVLTLAGGDELRFVDPRRFGFVRAARTRDEVQELAILGPDPLADLDERALAGALATSRAPVKSFLLDQRRIAGLGNIYVAEALYRAGIHPRTPARRTARRAGPLLDGIRAALAMAIDNRGTTMRDFVDGAGEAGENYDALLVYGREGRPCPRCGHAVRRSVDAGRSTFYCAHCQKR